MAPGEMERSAERFMMTAHDRPKRLAQVNFETDNGRQNRGRQPYQAQMGSFTQCVVLVPKNSPIR